MDQARQFPLWISSSKISDFLSCPRAYYLKHMYKDPRSGYKISIMNPSLALGQTVHDVIETIADLPCDQRFSTSLTDTFHTIWEGVRGDLGGFVDAREEETYKKRGLAMIQRLIANPGPLLQKAIRIKSPDTLPPRYLISPEENILLCGKVDWLTYLPQDNSLHIIDFKTGINEEKKDSLQLPIYCLIAKNCQKRTVTKTSYWYLEYDNEPVERHMPDLNQAREIIIDVSLRIKKYRHNKEFSCPKNGCYACRPLDNIVSGNATYIRSNAYQDIYITTTTTSH